MSGLCRIPAASTWILISFVYPLMWTFHQLAARVRGRDARNHFLWALLFVIPFSSLYDHPSLRQDISRIMQLVQETRTSPKARRVLAEMLSAVFARPSSGSPSSSGAS